MANNYISDYAVTEPFPALRKGCTGAPKTYTKGGEYAYGLITFADEPTATDTITLNGVVIEFSASATDFTTAGTVADPYIMQVTGTLATTLTNLASALNGSANASLSVATYDGSSGTTITVAYDTIGTAGNAYTLAASSDTPSGATLTGGEATKAITLDTENVAITLSDSRDQYFSLADGVEFQKKVIVLTAKSTGNAIITVASLDGSSNVAVTLSTAGQYLVYQFLDGEWKSLVDVTTSAINALTPTDGNFIVGDGTNWVAESGNTAIASLGVTATASELNALDLTTGAGTAEASKALVLDSSAEVAWAVSDAGTGTVTPIDFSLTATGVGAAVDGAKFAATTEIALGSYANAVNGKLDFGTAGSVTGLGGAICGELDLGPGTTSGSYAVFEGELNCPASGSLGTRTSFFSLNAWGANVAAVDTGGFLFDLNGLTAASGKLFNSGLSQAVTAAARLRVQVGGTTYYIPLCASEALTS